MVASGSKIAMHLQNMKSAATAAAAASVEVAVATSSSEEAHHLQEALRGAGTQLWSKIDGISSALWCLTAHLAKLGSTRSEEQCPI